MILRRTRGPRSVQ